jgi:hypothetical protein
MTPLITLRYAHSCSEREPSLSYKADCKSGQFGSPLQPCVLEHDPFMQRCTSAPKMLVQQPSLPLLPCVLISLN